MYKDLSYTDDVVVVHVRTNGSAATSGFTKSSWMIDPVARTLQIKDYEPLPLPTDLQLLPGGSVKFALAGPDGVLRKQARTFVCPAALDAPFKVAGQMVSPEAREASKEFQPQPFKFRAYATHPGVATTVGETGGLPRWFRQHVMRCDHYWHRLAILCRKARTGKETADAIHLIDTLIRPAYDAFNDSLGKVSAKSKLRYPDAIKVKFPSLSGLLGIAYNLEEKAQAGRPVPEGLAAAIREYVGAYTPDYGPLNAFQNAATYNRICKEERILSYPSLMSFQRTLNKHGVFTSEEYRAAWVSGRFQYLPENPESVYGASAVEVFAPIAGVDPTVELTEEQNTGIRPTGNDAVPMTLRWYEIAPLKKTFMAALKSRRTRKLAFYKGWPHPSTTPGTFNLAYYQNGAGCTVADLFSTGISGLRLGTRVSNAASGGNKTPGSRRDSGRGSKRVDGLRPDLNCGLYPAEIHFKGTLSGELCSLKFAVQIHRAMPMDAPITEWQLTCDGGEYHLVISAKVPRVKPLMPTDVAALNLGWRSTASGIKLMTLFTPGAEFKEGFVNLTSPQPGTGLKYDAVGNVIDPGVARQPFVAYMGQTRRALRDQKNGYPLPPDVFDSTEKLQTERDTAKDTLKKKLQVELDNLPSWLKAAGIQGMRKLLKNMRTEPGEYTAEDLALIPEIEAWLKKDEFLGEQFAALWSKLSNRLANEYQLLAHQICQYLLDHGVTVLAYPAAVDDDEEESTPKKKGREKKGMLQQLAAKPGNFEDEAIKASKVNKQRAGVSIFVHWLCHIAGKYGLTVIPTSAKNVTLVHNACGHKNRSAGGAATVVCAGCGQTYDQDENAALNLAASAKAELFKGQKPVAPVLEEELAAV